MPRHLTDLLLDEYFTASNTDIVPFLIQVQRNEIPGASLFRQRFIKRNLQIADGEIDSIGSEVLTQKWSVPLGVTSLFISSTSTADTTNSARVEYLDGDFAEQTSIVTMNGQTPVEIADDFFRIRSLTIVNGVVSAGDVYLFGGTTATSGGVPDFEQTIHGAMATGRLFMSQYVYCCPKDKTFHQVALSVFVSGKNAGDVERSRTVFRIAGPNVLELQGIAEVYGPGSSETVIGDPGLSGSAGQTVITSFTTNTNNMTVSEKTSILELGPDFDQWITLKRSGFIFNNEVVS